MMCLFYEMKVYENLAQKKPKKSWGKKKPKKQKPKWKNEKKKPKWNQLLTSLVFPSSTCIRQERGKYQTNIKEIKTSMWKK